jgi:hypothetical protein
MVMDTAWWACRLMDMAVTGTAITAATARTAGMAVCTTAALMVGTEARTMVAHGMVAGGTAGAGTAGEFTSAESAEGKRAELTIYHLDHLCHCRFNGVQRCDGADEQVMRYCTSLTRRAFVPAEPSS